MKINTMKTETMGIAIVEPFSNVKEGILSGSVLYDQWEGFYSEKGQKHKTVKDSQRVPGSTLRSMLYESQWKGIRLAQNTVEYFSRL